MPHTFYRVFIYGDEQQGTQTLLPHTNLPRPHMALQDVYSAAELAEFLAQKYPEGISHHGEQYLFNVTRYRNVEQESYTRHMPMLELVFELVRQGQFPHAPSRFTSFFGWETLAEAEEFNRRYRDGQGVICRVTCEDYLRVDMNLLLLAASLPGAMLLAERYWRGEASNMPAWEILMRGPIHVVEVVH